ncbi:MAG: SPFH domain-containing protein [Candidatus Borkfalkiaceae bacterium]|nr:SPFH domain-containing protein [Christensenellaceae bacterium]
MALFSNLFRINIEWSDDSRNTMVYKYPFKNNGKEVNDKSSLTVRESQVAIFVYKGQIAEVFEPGLYELKTEILPVLTKLASWKYKFETPITLDVYFVNTKQFTNIKWGTQNPFMMRDPEFGVIRVRGFGSFAYKVNDAPTFMRQLFGTNSSFKTEDIQEYLKGILVSGLTDAIGESKISALDLAGNTQEFQTIVKSKIQQTFKDIGLELTNLVIENMSVPSEVEKALDERSRLGILGGATDTMMKVAAAEALKDAAKNPGMGGAFMGAGIGLGAGAGMGSVFADAFKTNSSQNSQPAVAAKPEEPKAQTAGVCPDCGKPVSAGAKFCPECGAKIPQKKFCPECGNQVEAGAKFCPECGKKL